MSFFEVKLKDLLHEFEESHGVARLVVMEKLRTYVAKGDLLTVIDEIRTITDVHELNVLIGVGMRGMLWDAVIQQRARLEGVP